MIRFPIRTDTNSLWYNNICCSIGHMSELTWAAASCVDWLFSCMSFCAFEKFIDDTYNRVERRVNAVKSFLFLTSHTAWMVIFVLNLLLSTLLLPVYKMVDNDKFYTSLTILVVCSFTICISYAHAALRLSSKIQFFLLFF